jgi:DNA-binding beta-propeller fold protein YncE
MIVTPCGKGVVNHGRIATVAYQAATGAWLWVAAYLGPVNTDSTATSAVLSPDGRQVFVTGHTVTQHGISTGVTVAYQAATGAKAWTALSPGASFGSAAVSPDGSTVFTVGTNDVGMLTVAYNAASGATRWTQDYTPGAGGGGAAAVAVSPDGSTVFVAGRVPTASVGDLEYATVAYQAATGTMRWAQLQNGVNGSFGDDSGATALAVSPDGATVFATGSLTTADGASYGTVAYNAATGTKLWLTLYQSPAVTTLNDFAASIAVSPDGSAVFVTGAANSRYGTVAYVASTGAQEWVDLYHPGISAARSVAVSPDGSTVFVTGVSAAAHTSSQVATIAYTAATGATVWLRRYPGFRSPTGYGEGHAVAVNPNGSAVYVTGLFQDPLNKPGKYVTLAYSP